MFLTRGDISAYLCEAPGTQVQIYHLTFLSQAICKFRPFVEATQKLSWRAKHHDHAKEEAVEGRYGDWDRWTDVGNTAVGSSKGARDSDLPS